MGSERGGFAPPVALTSTWLHTYHVLLMPAVHKRSLGSDSALLHLRAFMFKLDDTVAPQARV